MDETKIYHAFDMTAEFIAEQIDPDLMTLDEAAEYLSEVIDSANSSLSAINDDIAKRDA
jgi:hypothetical protein